LRSGLRTFNELTEQTYCERRGFVQLLLGRQVDTLWVAPIDDTGTYSTQFTEEFEGVPLEVGAVVGLDGQVLTRKESVSEVSGTADSFYFLPGSPSTLYVHLEDDADPRDTIIRVDFLRLFSSVGSTEPLFGPEKLANATLQDWPAPTDLGSWNEIGVSATGVAVQQIVVDGVFAAMIRPGASGQSAGAIGGIQQAALTTVIGGLYWTAIEYSTSPDIPPELTPRLRVRLSPVGNSIADDGRTETATTTGLELKKTGGERKRAIFAWRAPTTNSSLAIAALLHNGKASSISTGYMIVYSSTFRPVWRYEYVEPRLGSSALPAVEISSEDPFMGAESVGLTGIRLLNRDGDADMPRGYLETLLGSYDVGGRYAAVQQGGSFDDGQEITRDDLWSQFSGEVRDYDVGDLDATLDAQDTRLALSVLLPVETLGRTVSPEMSDRDVGRPRPILIGGPKYNMRPPRVALGLTNRLPIFEVNDPTWGNGTDVMGQVAMWAYTDEDAANRRDQDRRVACEFTSDATTGRASMFSNPGPFEIFGGAASADVVREVRMNDALDIILDGVTYVVYLTPGLYTCTTLCAAAEAALDALVVPDVAVAYSNTTHQVSVNYAGGTMSIPLSSGANKHRSAWPVFGFEGSADLSGLSQSGTALYDESRADQFIIRVDATGYRDHTDGRFTGVTGGGTTAIIYKIPTALHFILVKILGLPSSSIDLASFVAARTSHQIAVNLYLGGLGPSATLTVQEIIDRFEVSTHADVSLDGNGVWYWRPRATSSVQLAEQAATAPLLTDRDFLSFRSGKTIEDTYASVILTYDEDPVTGIVKTREASNNGVALRHNQRLPRQFDTLCWEAADVQAQAWNQMLLAVLPRRRVTFSLKGRLLKKTVGDLVRIQRTRMLGAEVEGMANEEVFRILSIRKDPQTHVCNVVAYTADLPRALDEVGTIMQVFGQALDRGLAELLGLFPRNRQHLIAGRPGLV
jgi:hypothetical protein